MDFKELIMRFISYYYDKDPNKSTFYKDCYVNLEKQITSFGQNIHSENINFREMNIDAYDKLNLYKPTYILQKLEQFKEPVVWIDADTTVNSKVTEFENINCDIGFAIREHDNKTPHAALIYFGYTDNSINFLCEWEKLCIEKMNVVWDCTEHCILVDLFNNLDHTYNISKFYGLASVRHQTKVKIGISPAGWEYERNKQ
jgi:hypothetical protein